MLRTFKSIAHETEFGYAYDSQAYDHKATVDCHFRIFQTYGDGLTQHSGDWSITIEHIADYLASLAQAMLTDEELTETMYFTLHRHPSIKDIEFAASVIYKAPKDGEGWSLKGRKWFSLTEKKVSASESKQHDKRYTEVSDIHDGSLMSIYRILIPEYADNMERYATADAIREWALTQDDMYMELPACFLKWFDGDRDKARQLRDAYEACKNVTEAYRLRSNTESAIENYKRSIKPKAECDVSNGSAA